MLRGLLSGLIVGGFVMAVLLSAVSLVIPLPEKQVEDASQTEAGAASDDIAEMEANPDEEIPTDVEETSEDETPVMTQPENDDSPVVVDNTSAIVPESGEVSDAMEATQEGESDLPEETMPSDTSLAGVQVDGMTAPVVDSTIEIAFDPAQPQPPEDESLGMTGEETLEATAVEETLETTAVEEMADEAPEQSNTFASSNGLTVDESIVTNRLPTVASGAVSEGSPLVVNAEPFVNPDNKPVMAIVLLDTGEFNINKDALSTFPYPITFAVDPFAENALEKAEAYRSRGFEVIVIADLPSEGDGELAGIALQPTLNSFPGIVGAIEGTETGLQGNMELSEGVLGMIADSGYGLVLRPKGLNAAQQIAEGRSLPVETVFRDIDASDQDATVIRRFLDQAAFKARQEGEIVMVGRLRPATISALLLWGLQDRASTVALAPVSAVLRP